MANWTNIPTDRIEPGKPIRAIDGLALRDNPIAIAEGASGAPKIREAAISTNSINGNRLRTNSVPNDRLVNKTITNTKIANNTITGDLFNDGSVRSWLGSQSAGAVGTYAFVATNVSSGGLSWGSTISGSSLRRASIEDGGSIRESGALSGTWRVMGSTPRGAVTNSSVVTIALRIS